MAITETPGRQMETAFQPQHFGSEVVHPRLDTTRSVQSGKAFTDVRNRFGQAGENTIFGFKDIPEKEAPAAA